MQKWQHHCFRRRLNQFINGICRYNLEIMLVVCWSSFFVRTLTHFPFFRWCAVFLRLFICLVAPLIVILFAGLNSNSIPYSLKTTYVVNVHSLILAAERVLLLRVGSRAN